MIVRRGIDLFRLNRHLGPLLAGLLLYDVIVTLLYVVVGWRGVGIDELPLPLLGSALVLVITIRNNAAYARWWEGRALWGAVVNNSRSLGRAVLMLLPNEPIRSTLIRLQAGYAVALRQHLLKQPPWDDLAPYVSAEDMAVLRQTSNVPVGIQTVMVERLAAHGLDPINLSTIDRTLSALADAQGGLERIKNTPLPRQYMQFPRVFSGIYCILLPLGLVSHLGVLTPIGSTLIGFMFLALDRIGQDLEDPFEGKLHDIPMQAISRTIEIDLLQMIGATTVPPPITPVDGVLA